MKILSDIRKEFDFTKPYDEIVQSIPQIIENLKEFQSNFTKVISYLEKNDPDTWSELNMSLYSKKTGEWLQKLIFYCIESLNIEGLNYIKENNFFPDIKAFLNYQLDDYCSNAKEDNIDKIEQLKSLGYLNTTPLIKINYHLSVNSIERLYQVNNYDIDKSLEEDFESLFKLAADADNIQFLDYLLAKAKSVNLRDREMINFVVKEAITTYHPSVSSFLIDKIDFTGYKLHEYLESNNITQNEYEKFYFLAPRKIVEEAKARLWQDLHKPYIQEAISKMEEKQNVYLEREKLLSQIKTYEGSLFFKEMDKKMKSNITEIYSLIKNEEIGLKKYFKNEEHNVINLFENYFTHLNDLLLFNKDNYKTKQFEDHDLIQKVSSNNEILPLIVNHFFQAIKIATIKKEPSQYLENQANELAVDLIKFNEEIKETMSVLKKEVLLNNIHNNRTEKESAEKISTRKKI